MKKLFLLIAMIFTIQCSLPPIPVQALDGDLTEPVAVEPTVQEIRLSLGGEPTSLDFSYGLNSADIDVYNYLMEGLSRNGGDGKASYGIASSWDVSEDGKTWTFHLRDAKWSDGADVTAQQFKDGWIRSLNPADLSAYSYLLYDIVNCENYAEGKLPAEEIGVTVLDSKTLKVQLNNPVTYFDALVAMPIFSPFRADLLSESGEYNADTSKIITNGPFTLSDWELGKSMIFEKNPTYWNNSAIRLTRVIGYIFDYSAYTDKVDMYQKGNLDIIDHVDYSSFNTIGKANIQSYLDGSAWYLSYNCADKTLKNKNIRKALAYGIDRNKYLNAAFPYRKYIPATSLVAPMLIPDATVGTFRENAPLLFRNNDVLGAKKLLKLGLSELKIKSLPTLTILVNKTVLGIAGGDALASMWKKNLGITVKVKALSSTDRLKKLDASQYQITLTGWGPDYPDPMTYLNIFTTDNPMSNTNYSSPEYDKMILDAKASANKSEKFQLMHSAEALLMEDMPICPLFFRKNSYSVKSYVKNVTTNAFSPNINFLYSYIEK